SVRNARWGSHHSPDEIYRPRRSQRLGAARDKKGQTARLSGLVSCTLPLLKFTFLARTYSCESATSSGRRSATFAASLGHPPASPAPDPAISPDPDYL